ncbi:MAG: hypothetical protein WD096_03735 [Actinomycetota bacterium]
MRTTLRTAIATLSAITVLAISAIAAGASGTTPSPMPAEDGGGGAAGACEVGTVDCNDTPGTPIDGDGMAMCVEGVPDCNDMIVDDGGQTEPGSGSGGSIGGGPITLEPDDGSLVHDVPCGVEVVEGDGPDATVSYTPCDSEDPPAPIEPTITEPTPGMANVAARPFDSATVGDDDRTVTIDFVSGIEPCYVLDHISVEETSGAVTITLFEGSDLTDGQVACIEIGVFKRAIITLDQPLAGRTIVDGAA